MKIYKVMKQITNSSGSEWYGDVVGSAEFYTLSDAQEYAASLREKVFDTMKKRIYITSYEVDVIDEIDL